MNIFSNLFIFIFIICSTTAFTAQVGKLTKNFSYQGYSNFIELYVPLDYDSTKSYPMLMGWHGAGMQPSVMRDLLIDAISMTGINAIISCPNWNNITNNNEFSITMSTGYFLPQQDYNIDTFKIVVTGFSDGGGLAYQLGLQFPEMFKGIIGISPVIRTSQYPESIFNKIKSIKMTTIVGDKDEFFPMIDSSMKDIQSRGGNLHYIIKPDVIHGDNKYLNSQEFFEDYKICYDYIMGEVEVKENSKESEIELMILPNPVNDFLILSTNNRNYKFEIFSVFGIKVLESEYKDKIEVTGLAPGVYFLKSVNKVYKFIKI